MSHTLYRVLAIIPNPSANLRQACQEKALSYGDAHFLSGGDLWLRLDVDYRQTAALSPESWQKSRTDPSGFQYVGQRQSPPKILTPPIPVNGADSLAAQVWIQSIESCYNDHERPSCLVAAIPGPNQLPCRTTSTSSISRGDWHLQAKIDHPHTLGIARRYFNRNGACWLVAKWLKLGRPDPSQLNIRVDEELQLEMRIEDPTCPRPPTLPAEQAAWQDPVNAIWERLNCSGGDCPGHYIL